MQVKKIETGYLICLAKGEKIIERLTEIIGERQIGCGTISGVGAVNATELGFFHAHTKSYDRKIFPEEAELLQLMGNVSWLDGKPFPHCHVTLGLENFQTVGGHLFEAEIAVTGEIYINPSNFKANRKFEPDIGLNLLHWDA